ncbi:MAG: gamma-glutamyl-gamma-aminobutyrate hydrolase family protein [Gemmatimonadaceae bacterium]
MPRNPIIGLTATSEIIRGMLRVRVNAAYVQALEEAGAIPVVIPPLCRPTEIGALLDAMDGLLLPGGEDVNPVLYGAAPHPALGGVHERRDATELALVAAARARRLPTLGICRGAQLVNVALGATLVQDLPRERPGEIVHDQGDGDKRASRVHEACVEPGSRLFELLGAGELRVNSSHHQALDRLGAGLRAVAWAPDQSIEGVEWSSEDWWLVGVQWHPEELVATPEPWDRRLFDGFAAAALGREAAP